MDICYFKNKNIDETINKQMWVLPIDSQYCTMVDITWQQNKEGIDLIITAGIVGKYKYKVFIEIILNRYFLFKDGLYY